MLLWANRCLWLFSIVNIPSQTQLLPSCIGSGAQTRIVAPAYVPLYRKTFACQFVLFTRILHLHNGRFVPTKIVFVNNESFGPSTCIPHRRLTYIQSDDGLIWCITNKKLLHCFTSKLQEYSWRINAIVQCSTCPTM